MTKEEILDQAINDVYLSFSEESSKQDQDVEMLTRDYLQAVLKAHLTDPSYAYRSGERLSYEDWRSSAAGANARTELDREIADTRRDYYDARARAIRGKNSQSGYSAYAAAERKNAYERAMQDGAQALAESYGEFYDERESGRSGATFDQRLSAISYIASNRMSEREGLLYALAVGLSYEEASELAHGAYLLGSLLDKRYEDYGNGLPE